MNRSTRKTPLDIITRRKPRGVLYLRDIVGEKKRSSVGEEFSDFMESFHKEVKLRLEQSN